MTLMLVAVLGGDPLDKMPAEQVAAILREYDSAVKAQRNAKPTQGGVFIPEIRELKQNSVGRLPKSDKLTVERLIAADLALIEIGGKEKRQFIITGVDVTKFVVGKPIRLPSIYRVNGTIEVDDEIGEMQTTPVLEPFDLHVFLATHHPGIPKAKSK